MKMILNKINLKTFKRNRFLVFMKMIKVPKLLIIILIREIYQLKYQLQNFLEYTAEISNNQIIKFKSKIFQKKFTITFLLK